MPRIPVATYRLQFNHHCTFREAARLIPYLHALGITDCYASSLLKAVPGSLHGYDLIDPGELNPELGNQADFSAFSAALKQYDMGLLLDVVPNHMGNFFESVRTRARPISVPPAQASSTPWTRPRRSSTPVARTSCWSAAPTVIRWW